MFLLPLSPFGRGETSYGHPHLPRNLGLQEGLQLFFVKEYT
jgi:hypothetical protein